MARPPMVRYNIGAEDSVSFSENRTLVVPVGMLLPKKQVERVLKATEAGRGLRILRDMLQVD